MRDILSQDPGAGENFSFKISGKDEGEKRKDGCLLTAYLCQALRRILSLHYYYYYFLCGVHVYAKSFQLCPTLCGPVDYSPPGSSVHRIFQARILEWPFPSPGDLPDPGLFCGT